LRLGDSIRLKSFYPHQQKADIFTQINYIV